MLNKKNEKWSNAHTSYDISNFRSSHADSPKETQSEHEWRLKLLNETPNGKLSIKNSLFDNLKRSAKLYFAHITLNLDEILRSGLLYPSGGCLVGGIYASPLFEENGKFRAHNLGKYIFEKEAPQASRFQNKKGPHVLIIEVTSPPHKSNPLIGIDYTRLGAIHLDTYREFENFLPPQENLKLRNIVLDRIKYSLKFLNLVNSSYINKKNINPNLFFELLVNTIKHLPILGYLYFETISEYLMLYQDSEEARKAHTLGEFYTHSYKKLMFDLFPGLLRGQGLSCFNPTLKQLLNYIKQEKIISQFNQDRISNHLINRLIFLINSRLLNADHPLINLHRLERNFDGIAEVASPLLGHVIYRESINFNKHFDLDQLEAIQVWDYWNHIEVAIPFNGFIQKGESGINPAYPNLKYQIYSGVTDTHSGNLYLMPNKKLDVKIIPQLVNKKHIAMRI